MQTLLNWLDPILNPLAVLPKPPESESLPNDADAVLKRLDAMLRNQLRYALSGDKRSILRGQGLDFADLREYVPGDDIRKIDWNVFARTLTPHVREYHEEKQLTLWLAVDATPSMRFGRNKSKLAHAIELAGLFGLMAQQAGHKLGAFIWDGRENIIVPPKTGYAQLQQVMNALLKMQAPAPPQSAPLQADLLTQHFGQLGHLVSKHSTVVVLSDFLSAGSSWQIALGQLSRHADMLFLALQDPTEMQLSGDLGLLGVLDPETGDLLEIDTCDPAFQQQYRQHIAQHQDRLREALQGMGRFIPASTAEEPVSVLLNLIRKEGGGRKRGLA